MGDSLILYYTLGVAGSVTGCARTPKSKQVKRERVNPVFRFGVGEVKKKALFEVYRQDSKDTCGYFKKFTLVIDDDISVYDALWTIRDEIDTSLALPYFRCRKGVCGSCLMRINGVQRLACRIPVRNALSEDGIIQVAPPKGRPVLKDLVTGWGDHDEV